MPDSIVFDLRFHPDLHIVGKNITGRPVEDADTGEYHPQHLEGSLTNDAQVKPEIGVPYIKCIVLVATENALISFGRTTITFYLRQSCYARFNKASEFIISYQLGKPVAIGMHVRPGANNTHIAEQHIQKLWKFIEA